MAFGKLSAKFNAKIQDEYLLLEDLAEEYQCMSITNDAEEVVKWATKNITGWSRILYKDTVGQWDELVVQNGEFKGFRCIGETDEQTAIDKANSIGVYTPKKILQN